MPWLFDPRYQHCSRIGATVGICRSEGDCRGEHGCVEPNCPLEKVFGVTAFDERMRAFATVFDLWPLHPCVELDYP